MHIMSVDSDSGRAPAPSPRATILLSVKSSRGDSRHAPARSGLAEPEARVTGAEVNPNAWRGVIAALAHPDSRRVLGLLLADLNPFLHLDRLTPSRRARVVHALASAGILDTADSDLPRLRAEIFAELLAADPVERSTALDRFFVDGQLDQYPARATDRALVLQHVVEQVLPDASELIDERTLTGRIAAITDDPVTMRRYLVDAGLLDREPDGSSYRRSPSAGASDSPPV